MPIEATTAREAIAPAPNPLGLDGIEYIEFTTPKPQALGQLLEAIGFRPVARHRSREVLLYRQGPMNVVVNAHAGVTHVAAAAQDATPSIRALALRVRDARSAYERALELGAWDVPMHAQVMELNIPAIHGPGGAHIYFVDRYREFSIYSVDFVPIPGVDPAPAAHGGLHFFGIVQYIGRERTADWVEFYGRLFGFERLSDATRFGVLPRGTVLQSPGSAASRFYLQLIEPDASEAAAADASEQEHFHRIGFGTPDVAGAVAGWRARGLEFVDSGGAAVTQQGAITRPLLETVSFELVHDARTS